MRPVRLSALLEVRRIVRDIATKTDLPSLDGTGLCALFLNTSPTVIADYRVMCRLLQDTSLFLAGLGMGGEWSEHRLNVLCLIDNLTDAEWLELFYDSTIIDDTATPSQEPTAGTQDPS